MIHVRRLFSVLVALVLTSCLDACNERARKDVVNIEKNPGIAGALAPADCVMSAALPILWVETSTLLAPNGPLVFRFYVDDWCDLTLKAWSPPFNNSGPVVSLKTSILSNIDVSKDNYLGNLYLSQPMINDIKREVTAHGYQYIKFYPVIDQRSGSSGQVTYRYSLTNSLPRLKSLIPKDSVALLMDSVMYSLTDTSMAVSDYLNPSPPRSEQ